METAKPSTAFHGTPPGGDRAASIDARTDRAGALRAYEDLIVRIRQTEGHYTKDDGLWSIRSVLIEQAKARRELQAVTERTASAHDLNGDLVDRRARAERACAAARITIAPHLRSASDAVERAARRNAQQEQHIRESQRKTKDAQTTQHTVQRRSARALDIAVASILQRESTRKILMDLSQKRTILSGNVYEDYKTEYEARTRGITPDQLYLAQRNADLILDGIELAEQGEAVPAMPDQKTLRRAGLAK